MSIKTSLGKLRLESSLQEIIAGYVNTGTSLLPIGPEHAMEAGSLPWHHRDPFDRMLVAQAQLEALTLVTVDTFVKQYDVPNIW